MGHEDAEAGIESFSAGRGRNSLGSESIFVGSGSREAKDEENSSRICCAELVECSFLAVGELREAGDLLAELGQSSSGHIFKRPEHLEASPDRVVAQLERTFANGGPSRERTQVLDLWR